MEAKASLSQYYYEQSLREKDVKIPLWAYMVVVLVVVVLI
jgi:hypothetical protein